MSYETTKLGNVCEFLYGDGLIEAQRRGGEFPVYGSNGIVGWHDQAITKGPTIIIGRKGSIGEVHFSKIPCWPIDTTYYVQLKKKACDLNWLYYTLLALDLTKLNKSAAVPGLNRNDAYEKEILLPPLDDQKRIAAILSKANRLRHLRRYSRELSDGYLQSVFLEMFGDPVSNPRGWKISEIEELLSKDRAGTRTGPFGSSLKRHEYVDQGIPVWGINNVKENEFVEKGSLFITPSKYRQLTNYTVENGDILISRAGTVGRMCIARPKQKTSIIGTNLVRVSLDFSNIIPEYFSALFTYFPDRVGRLRRSSDDNSYSFLNPTTLKSIEIQIPSLLLQQKFAQVVQKHERLRAQQRESERQGEHLFQSLLHRAFRGEV